MKKINLLGLALVLATCAPMARAQDPDAASTKLWRNFYILLANMVRGKQDTGSDKVFIMNVPGTFVPESWTTPSEEDRKTAFMLMNLALAHNPVHPSESQIPPRAELGKKTLSAVWKSILDTKKADPGPALSAAEKQKIKELHELTDDANPSYQLYKKYRDAYNEASWERETAIFANFAEKKGGSISPAIQSKFDDAKDRWDTNRVTIDTAFDKLRELTHKDPAVYWQELRREFNAAYIESIKAPTVTAIPQLENWSSKNGWIKFSFSMSDTLNTKNTNSNDYTFGGKVKVGFYKAKGSVSKSSKAMKEFNNTSKLSIQLEFKRVQVLRPWLDWDVFTSEKWAYPGGVISDGKGKGTLPLVVDAFILVRKVKFKSSAINTFKTELENEFHSDVNASYGPFSVNNKVNKESKDETDGGKEDKGEISIPDPQIIGYFCTVVPRCPAKTVK